MCLSKLFSMTFGSNRFLMVLFFSLPVPHPGALMASAMPCYCHGRTVTHPSQSHWRNFSLPQFKCTMLAWPLSVWCHYDKGKTIIQLENVLLREWGGGNSIKTLNFLPISPTWTFHPCNQCSPLYTLPARVISCLLLLSRYFHYRITWRVLRGSKVLKNNLLGG